MGGVDRVNLVTLGAVNYDTIIQHNHRGSSYLVMQVPGLIISLRTSSVENGPEVNFDKLPLRPMTEMTKDSEKKMQTKREINYTMSSVTKKMHSKVQAKETRK